MRLMGTDATDHLMGSVWPPGVCVCVCERLFTWVVNTVGNVAKTVLHGAKLPHQLINQVVWDQKSY